MANNTFVGYSTLAENSGRRSWVLYDIELIKRDLLNHFYTRLGERVMRPEFGCKIWDYVMEPNIEQVRYEIVAECERVVRLDQRLDVEDIRLFQKDHTVMVIMELIYRPFQTSEIFQLAFDRRQEVQ
jgi:phage baseplate assembly protein W